MIQQIFVAAQTAGPARSVLLQPHSAWFFAIFPCIMLLVGICFWGLVIFGLVKLIKYLGSAGKEQKLIRMELSKLADEVQQIRQDLKTKSTNEASEDR